MGDGDPFRGVDFSEDWARKADVREETAEVRIARYRRIRHASQQPFRSWTPSREESASVSRSRRLAAVLLAVIVVGGLVGAYAVRWPLRLGAPTGSSVVLGDRILPVVQPPAVGRGDHAFGHQNRDGTPVTFSPCRPWPVVVNLRGAPPGAYSVLVEALGRVQQVSGLQWILEGDTDEEFTQDRDAVQRGRYGDRWAPVLVSWAPLDGTEKAGTGGPLIVDDGEARTFVSGAVTLDPLGEFNRDPAALRAVILHEFGHVLGLSHVSDPHQLMYPTASDQMDYGPGDLAGLAAAGAGRCGAPPGPG